MDRSKITPGPWRWNSSRTFLVSELHGMIVSETFYPREADAKAIESVPEMVEALEAAQEALAICGDGQSPGSAEAASAHGLVTAALKKATK